MLARLNEQHISLIVRNAGLTTEYTQHGVSDLLQLLENEPQRLQGAVVADKMIGKAAAALMAVGGVKQVHTNLISTPAREMLEKAGVQVTAAEEVEMILNRDQTGQCPMDKSLNDTDDPAECVAILKNK
ncbi:MAG: DUF1893 domain-containing protein [Paludibacteraceae bacterium]